MCQIFVWAEVLLQSFALNATMNVLGTHIVLKAHCNRQLESLRHIILLFEGFMRCGMFKSYLIAPWNVDRPLDHSLSKYDDLSPLQYLMILGLNVLV